MSGSNQTLSRPGALPDWPANEPINPSGLIPYAHPAGNGHEMYDMPVYKLFGAKSGITAPDYIGQSAVVTHADGSKTEWGCVSVDPAVWLPRTSGIVQNADGAWYRHTLAADGTAVYNRIP